MRYNQFRAVLICAATLLLAGCNKKDDSKMNYQAAINDYYKAHPACIWQDTKKFPVQARDLGRHHPSLCCRFQGKHEQRARRDSIRIADLETSLFAVVRDIGVDQQRPGIATVAFRQGKFN